MLEDKINTQRKIEIEKEGKECTFTPKINKYSKEVTSKYKDNHTLSSQIKV